MSRQLMMLMSMWPLPLSRCQVSLPSGSLCAERAGIARAASEFFAAKSIKVPGHAKSRAEASASFISIKWIQMVASECFRSWKFNKFNHFHHFHGRKSSSQMFPAAQAIAVLDPSGDIAPLWPCEAWLECRKKILGSTGFKWVQTSWRNWRNNNCFVCSGLFCVYSWYIVCIWLRVYCIRIRIVYVYTLEIQCRCLT